MNLIVEDYFSRYLEVVQLKSTTLSSVIKAHKAIFSHHRVPSIFMSDNSPQFVSDNWPDTLLCGSSKVLNSDNVRWTRTEENPTLDIQEG